MFQIAGFSFIVPLGRMVTNFIDGELIAFDLRFFMALFVSVFLCICGIMLLLKALDCVENRRFK